MAKKKTATDEDGFPAGTKVSGAERRKKRMQNSKKFVKEYIEIRGGCSELAELEKQALVEIASV